ncbi:hypothetical protein MN608_00159 [Microdochium nivale]|nr:hypothetical protein MN608_00159 [Microdochium nivale]
MPRLADSFPKSSGNSRGLRVRFVDPGCRTVRERGGRPGNRESTAMPMCKAACLPSRSMSMQSSSRKRLHVQRVDNHSWSLAANSRPPQIYNGAIINRGDARRTLDCGVAHLGCRLKSCQSREQVRGKDYLKASSPCLKSEFGSSKLEEIQRALCGDVDRGYRRPQKSRIRWSCLETALEEVRRCVTNLVKVAASSNQKQVMDCSISQ